MEISELAERNDPDGVSVFIYLALIVVGYYDEVVTFHNWDTPHQVCASQDPRRGPVISFIIGLHSMLSIFSFVLRMR